MRRVERGPQDGGDGRAGNRTSDCCTNSSPHSNNKKCLPPSASQIPSFSLPTPSMWYTCTEKKDQLPIAVNANHLAKKAIYEITVLS